jgi:hypothetical protein
MKYYIKYEIVAKVASYKIYKKKLIKHQFIEQWDDPELALIRLNELNKTKSYEEN